MIFRGVGRRFSTAGDRQYQSIGDFWDAMAARYGRENLCGLGWDWTAESLCYAIGGIDCEDEWTCEGMEAFVVNLSEEGWQQWRGETDALDQLYEQIYRDGPLTYEIERFFEDGRCIVTVYREQNCQISAGKCGKGACISEAQVL